MAFSLTLDRFRTRTSRRGNTRLRPDGGAHRRRAFFAAVAALVSGTLALGGCSLRLEREPGTLPPLPHRAELREELFGIERAIESGATEMAKAAGASVPERPETNTDQPASDAASANEDGQYPLTAPTEPASSGNVSGEALVGVVVRSRARQDALGGPWQPWTQSPAPTVASVPDTNVIPANPTQLQELLEKALVAANELALLADDAGQAATATTLTISYAQELTALGSLTGRRSDNALLAAAPTSAKQHVVSLLLHEETAEAEASTQTATVGESDASAEPVASTSTSEETAAQLSIGSLLAINYVKWTAETAAIASEPEQRSQFTEVADRIAPWLLSAQPVSASSAPPPSETPEAEADMYTFSVDRSAQPRQWVEGALAQAVAMLMQEAVSSPPGDSHSPLRAVKRQAALMYAAQLAAMQVEWGASPSALPGQ